MTHIVPAEALDLGALKQIEPGTFNILQAATGLTRENVSRLSYLLFPIIQHAEGFLVHRYMPRVACFGGGAGNGDCLSGEVHL
ncbi:hypothetical protein D3C84_654190 [compost metagenome]